VGLAQAGAAVDEQRVVGPARRFHHGQRRGVREGVRRTDDEILEGVPRVQRHPQAARFQRAALGRFLVFRGGRGRFGRRPGAVHHEGDRQLLVSGGAERLADQRQVVLFEPVLVKAVRDRQRQLPGTFIPDRFDHPDPALEHVRRHGGRQEFARLRPDLLRLARFHENPLPASVRQSRTAGGSGTIQNSPAVFRLLPASFRLGWKGL